MSRGRLALVLVALALGLAVVGAAIGGTTKLKLSAAPGFAVRFDKKTLTAKAGKVTIALHVTKAGGVGGHNIAIKGHGVNVRGKVVSGGTSTVTALLKKGTYEFYCSVPGHETDGMKGTLIVK